MYQVSGDMFQVTYTRCQVTCTRCQVAFTRCQVALGWLRQEEKKGNHLGQHIQNFIIQHLVKKNTTLRGRSSSSQKQNSFEDSFNRVIRGSNMAFLLFPVTLAFCPSREGRATGSRTSPVIISLSPAQPSGSARPTGLGWAWMTL